jgi:hypothetical protein
MTVRAGMLTPMAKLSVAKRTPITNFTFASLVTHLSQCHMTAHDPHYGRHTIVTITAIPLKMTVRAGMLTPMAKVSVAKRTSITNLLMPSYSPMVS